MSYVSETYRNESRIPRFSHPSITYNGYPTGISTSRDDSAFVARASTNNRHVAAGTHEFAYEQIRYRSYGYLSSTSDCGFWRTMALWNEGESVISMESQNYVRPDGSITTYSLEGTQLPPNSPVASGWCLPESEPHYLGTTYTESFYRYYHPTTGELVDGPRFQWSETYVPQSEVRIAYTEGGKPVGNTVRMIPVGEQEDIVLQADQGFALDEIKSTCEGNTISDGFRVRATSDPCLLEASFSNVSQPPAAPTISSIEAGDGFAYVNVSTSDDGGAEITAISAECAFDSLVYSGESASSPVLISGLLNGRTYECSARATNVNGTSPASASVSTTLAQTMPSRPTISSTDSGDGELILFVSGSSQSTTVDTYKATCTDGTDTYTGTSTSSPITISGLNNGVAYTCTVTATNSVGTSSASAATDPITPEESTDGVPVWFIWAALNPADPYFSNVVLLLNAEETGAAQDQSSFNHEVSFQDNAAISSASRFGEGAYQFDGDLDYISLPDSAFLDLATDNWTVEFWLKSTGQVDDYNYVLSSPHGAGLSITKHSKSPGRENKLSVTVTNCYGNNECYIAYTFSDINLNDGEWYFLSTCRRGDSLMTWVDGQLLETYPFSDASVGVNLANGRVGRFIDNFSYNNFHGWVDDFRVTAGVCRYTDNFSPPTRSFPTR